MQGSETSRSSLPRAFLDGKMMDWLFSRRGLRVGRCEASARFRVLVFLRCSDQSFRDNSVVQSWRCSSGLDSQLFKSFNLRR